MTIANSVILLALSLALVGITVYVIIQVRRHSRAVTQLQRESDALWGRLMLNMAAVKAVSSTVDGVQDDVDSVSASHTRLSQTSQTSKSQSQWNLERRTDALERHAAVTDVRVHALAHDLAGRAAVSLVDMAEFRGVDPVYKEAYRRFVVEQLAPGMAASLNRHGTAAGVPALLMDNQDTIAGLVDVLVAQVDKDAGASLAGTDNST